MNTISEYCSALDKLRTIETMVGEWRDALMIIDVEKIYRWPTGRETDWLLIKYSSVSDDLSFPLPGSSDYWPVFWFDVLAADRENAPARWILEAKDFCMFEVVNIEDLPLYVGAATLTDEFKKLLSG